ncbi:uncharacterized protein HD556DRAFT_1451696 [Suillus plorans]|uniref:Uncharacterized protein n=1 Tax=Suillus plorans TaxID=116603 RepID=A0A9P7A9B7_9AGAM|nr:uncharacterized protein HD556DRAFT_1451696 [Suillus plorans]KAG1784498.1 hypothetical protein HD556DRAFT_1451696 [Suillus plorans]
MDPGGSDNFLKLTAALKIILGCLIQLLHRATQILVEYLLEYLDLYPNDVKPDHHYVTHISDPIRDYTLSTTF